MKRIFLSRRSFPALSATFHVTKDNDCVVFFFFSPRLDPNAETFRKSAIAERIEGASAGKTAKKKEEGGRDS